MKDFDFWLECSRPFIDAARRPTSTLQRFPECRARLDELESQARELVELQRKITGEEMQQQLALAGWCLCSCIWVYRGSGPICRHDEFSLAEIREILRQEIAECKANIQAALRKKDSQSRTRMEEQARIDELQLALEIFEGYTDEIPRF